MKKITTLTLAVLLAAGCTKPASSTPVSATPETEETGIQEMVKAYVDAIDMEYAYNLTYTLSTDPSMHENELGFRTSGSDAEHKAADFIAEEMKKIGLVEVEKVPVTVDKWQFNGAELTIADSDLTLTPVSYMCNGTDENGITAEIVDLGTGFVYDYEDVDVEGKIVLVGVDQWNESWIDGYIYEANEHGAAALVTYDMDGYGRFSSDDHQIQDICCEDLMPTVIITANEYEALAAELEAGHNMCTLKVDSVMVPNGGTSYNVVGKIKGKSSAQQMIFAGHYDMYFTGFQDDCSAIATAMSMAKAMIDSGYTPENDVLVVAHGAEEWGSTGTEFDWTRGAWEMIDTAHPEWAEKTLALFNYELCAFDDGGDTFAVSCVPEYATLVGTLVEEGLLDYAASEYANGVTDATFDTTTMEDGVSYRHHGVPYFINVTDTCAGNRSEDEYGWTQLHYHTESDNADTYCEKVMKANIGVFGSIAIAIDQNPAMMLDLTATVYDLMETFDAEYAAMNDGVDVDAWNAAAENLMAAAEALNAKAADINARYASASAEEKDAIRAEGTGLNKEILSVFKAIQDNFISIIFSSDIVTRHMGYLENLYLIDAVTAALEEGDIETALDTAYAINGIVEYNYYIFSPEAVKNIEKHVDASTEGNKWWGTDKGFYLADTYQATLGMLAKAEEENPDFTEEIAIYKGAHDAQLAFYQTAVNEEITNMNEVASLMK